MIKNPFFSSVKVIILMPLLLFLLNGAMIYYLGFDTIVKTNLDKILHILGGVCVSFSASGVVWNLVHRNVLDIQDSMVFRLLVFGSLCFAVVSWEILEYLVGIGSEYLTYQDTILDMICGISGGCLVLPFVWINRAAN